MDKSQDQPDGVFKSLSGPKITKELPNGIANDALSIVLDAINSSVGGMIITDREGFIRFANPSFCRMFNYSSATSIIGKNAAELFSPHGVKRFSDVITIIDISKDDTEEFVVKRKDGINFTVEVSASNVKTVSGELVGRMASFVNISKRKEAEADREKLIKKLQDALDKVRVLRGIIPICASCKKIRDDKGYWNQIERYISNHSDVKFSHGVCPECAKNSIRNYMNR